MATPDGPQFIRVVHSSRSNQPPHEIEYPDKAGIERRMADNPLGNQHPDIIHAGTVESADAKSSGLRPFHHEYEIDMSEAYPVTFGDEEFSSNKENTVDKVNYLEPNNFKENMKGVQEGLFETVVVTPDIAIRSNRAVPYRNRVEDAGGVSYMIPKGAVGKGVRYVGVKTVKNDYGIE